MPTFNTLRPSEMVRSYTYDTRGWLTGFSDARYLADQQGTCAGSTVIDTNGGACLPSQSEAPSQVLGGTTYTYDAAGNRFNAANGDSVETGNRLAVFNTFQFTYDADGNLTRRWKPSVDDLQPTWNMLGQMTGAWRYQKGTVSYGYDASGRRVRRTAPDGSVTRYLYDGDDLLMELDGAGNPIREYTYYPGVDQPHSVRISATGQTYYYATDNPGHVVGLIDASNQVVNQYAYTPWGESESAGETVPQPLRYMAREYDEVTGLYQVRARWYDPQQGRFVSEDPIGLAGGLNVYAYAWNNSISNTDPTGLDPVQLAPVTGNGYCEKGKVRGPDGRCQEAQNSGGTTGNTGPSGPSAPMGPRGGGGGGGGQRGGGASGQTQAVAPKSQCNPNPGYWDAGFTIGFGIGWTAGVIRDDNGGWFGYSGMGLTTPGKGITLLRSNSRATEGGYISLTFVAGLAGQLYKEQNSSSVNTALGVGGPAGVSLMATEVLAASVDAGKPCR